MPGTPGESLDGSFVVSEAVTRLLYNRVHLIGAEGVGALGKWVSHSIVDVPYTK